MSVIERDVVRLARALREVKVRFARDSEGSVIAQMVHSSHEGVPNTSWEKVYPSWIVAEREGEIVGCVQVCHSVPIGRLEFLSFLPNLPYRTRALAVKALLNLGALALKKTGAHVLVGCLGFDQAHFRDLLKAEGCTVLMSGNIIGKAVA